MKRIPKSNQRASGDSRFPLSTFWIVLAVLLVTAGISQGLQIGMGAANWVPALQVHIIVFYWIGAAALLTWVIRERMKRVYDEPLQGISAATKRVAKGDFTVRVPLLHEPKKRDYLDAMVDDLNAMIVELGSIETLRTDFVANVSHELKTPLAVIQNYGTMLQQRGLSEKQRMEYGEAISEASRRLADLISNILKLNRLENQQIFPDAKPYDLGEQLCETLLNYEHEWEEKEITIEADIGENIIVNADAELLNLVWSNLFSNAVKFTEKGGTVSVSLRKENGEAVMSVSDTGCGMTPETGAHIFEKFYQGDTSHAAQGNGLGLALVKRVIDITGSSISVKSRAGEGTTFIVRMRIGKQEGTEHG